MAHLPHHQRHDLTELQFSGFEAPKLHKQIRTAFEEYQLGERKSIQFLMPYQWDAKCILSTHRILWKNHGYKPISPFKLDQPKNHLMKVFDDQKKVFDDSKPIVEIIFFQPCTLTAKKVADCPLCGQTVCDAYTYLADIQHAFQYLVDSACVGDVVPTKRIRHELYKTFIRAKYGILNRHQRRAIPDCVLSLVRKAAPNPPKEDYVGFQDSPDA